MSCSSLPVMMYHYVSNFKDPISVSPARFEEHCRVLAEAGWRGVTLAEAEAYFLRGEKLPEKSCLFTFDDGFLDNYVHAWPILRKYGHAGVIFATIDRIGQGDGAGQADAGQGGGIARGEQYSPNNNGECRPTLADVWAGKCRKEDLPPVDAPMRPMEGPNGPLGYARRHDLFISWEEARRMEAEGMAVAAHSRRHDSVFAGPCYKAEEFACPGEQRRTFYHARHADLWGLPCLKKAPSLANPAFLPDTAFVDELRKLVPQDEARAWAFFQSEAGRERLAALAARYSKPSTGKKGRLDLAGVYESPQDRRARVLDDFMHCREALQQGLGHSVKTFCWPWGAYDDLALELGQEAGFELFFTTEYGVNPPASPLRIKRFKAKDKEAAWLLDRVKLYARPLLGRLYTTLRNLTS